MIKIWLVFMVVIIPTALWYFILGKILSRFTWQVRIPLLVAAYFVLGFLMVSFLFITGAESISQMPFEKMIRYWLFLDETEDPPYILLVFWPFIVIGGLLGGFR